MTTPLDKMIDTVRASDARLDAPTRDAILERILGAEDAPRFVPATMPATPTRRPWRRYAAVGAIGLALAAAAALVITQLGATTDPESVAVPPPPPPDDQVGGSVPQPPPMVGKRPAVVPPNALEQHRISGDKNIFPDDATKDEIAASGKTRLMVAVKVCIGKAGEITGVTIVGKGSGFPAYDQKLVREIGAWTYRPYLIDGVAAPVCSIVQFVYNQR